MVWQWITRTKHALSGFVEERSPTLNNTLWVFLLFSVILFTRSPLTNYIFDEQEALLANPYVNGNTLGFLDAFHRDFWGLPPARSIGSYRPIPNMIWRVLWRLHAHPWVPHVCNVIIHALNASLLASVTFQWSGHNRTSWLTGVVFLTAALITEATCGVVGLADVLGGLSLLLALASLKLPGARMTVCVFASLLLGMFSKESTLTAVVLLPLAALASAPLLHPANPRRLLRASGALVASAGALVVYTYTRRTLFPTPAPTTVDLPMAQQSPLLGRVMHTFLDWFRQPPLPQDPINNPLIEAEFPQRVASALRVYAEGLGQVLVPYPLSGDYSFAEEQVRSELFYGGSVTGGLLMTLPLLLGAALLLRAGRNGAFPHVRDAALAGSGLALLWIPLAYLPHSNIFKLLPTVRAERFWYLPMLGTSVLIALGLGWLWRRWRGGRFLVWGFLGFQAVCARWHALDYSSDLAFWRATAASSPRSAKAHLNYGIMLGAHGQGQAALEARLQENTRAVQIAPQWPLAQIYQGDVLCRLARINEAWAHYRLGFRLSPNDKGLIALSLQCLWEDESTGAKGSAIQARREELLTLASEHKGTWLDYLAKETVYRGKDHGGVEQQYRPRSYNAGPSQEK